MYIYMCFDYSTACVFGCTLVGSNLITLQSVIAAQPALHNNTRAAELNVAELTKMFVVLFPFCRD